VELKVDSFLNRNASYLKYVKDIQFAAHFHRRLRTRCPNDDDEDDDDNEMDDESAEVAYENETGSNLATPSRSVHDEFLKALESRLIPLINLITDGSLQKFRVVMPLASNLILLLTRMC